MIASRFADLIFRGAQTPLARKGAQVIRDDDNGIINRTSYLFLLAPMMKDCLDQFLVEENNH